ncbi:hypothetical protein [Caulobacter sp. LARHSG274]
MAINLESVEHFLALLDIPKAANVLDVGCQNVYRADPVETVNFIRRQNDIYDEEDLQAWARLFSIGSETPPEIGGLNGAWLGDLLERAGMSYCSYDIYPGYKTKIFDLNCRSVPPEDRGSFDLVFNLGTTEHVFNQVNALQVIHDAMAVGGYAIHVLPITLLDHGFFNYNPSLLVGLCDANDYDVRLLQFNGGLGNRSFRSDVSSRYADRDYKVPEHDDGWLDVAIPETSITLVTRKKHDRPFRLALDDSTTDGVIDTAVGNVYLAAGKPKWHEANVDVEAIVKQVQAGDRSVETLVAMGRAIAIETPKMVLKPKAKAA